MPRAIRIVLRNFVGLFLSVGLLVCGSNARAQTLPTQDALWAWDNTDGKLAVCSNPASQAAIDDCFSGYVSDVTAVSQLIATDGANVYAATRNSGWGYKCPIAGPGPNNVNCEKILVGPFNPNAYDSNDVYVTAIVAGNGYIWTAQLDGSIWRCPDNITWTGSVPSSFNDITAVECVQLDISGRPSPSDKYRYPSSLVLVGDTLYAGLRQRIEGKLDGLIWSCSSMTPDSCTTLDNMGQGSVLSVAVGAGFLWAGLDNNIVWRCDLTTANSCSDWNKAGNGILLMAYDGQGALGIGTGPSGTGVLWSCPTSYKNGCTTLLSGKNVFFGVAAGKGNVWGSYQYNFSIGNEQFAISLNGTNFKKFSGSAAPNLLFIPAGGPTTLGSARVQVPFVEDAKRLATFCAKKGRRTMADVSVSGPYGMKVKRRVNLCKLYDANAVRSEIKFGALDHGQYRVTVQSRSFYGQADFVLNDNNVQDVSVTLRKRRK